ncbi:MAG: hypothetical protein ABIX10_00155 [Acidimicrobiales bacterium]
MPSLLERAHALTPAVIALPAAVGVALTLGQILTTRYPDLGWGQAIVHDGKALATGTAIYADPEQQYTGMLYAPLFPVLLAPLYRIFWWDGWGLLLNVLAGTGLGVLVGGVAATGHAHRRWIRIVGGVGVGGTAFWIVSTCHWNVLFSPRGDGLAWLFALLGLCVLALGVARKWTHAWPAVLLLTAALWTKQTTVGAVLAAVLMTSWWAAAGTMPWRTWRRFVGGVVVANGLILTALMVLTDGWLWYFFFDLPARHYSDPAIAPYLSELARLLAIPVVVVVLAGGAVWQARRSAPSPRSVEFATLLAGLLVAFLVLQLAPSFLGRRKQGGGPNHYVGMMWALGLLLALAHREAQRSRRAMAAGIVAYALLASIALIPPVREAVTRARVVEPVAVPHRDVGEVDPVVIEYARSHLVFDSSTGVVSPTQTDEVWPPLGNLSDQLAAGESPGYLLDALIERRFDAVTHYSILAAAYVSRSGRTSEGYLPAVNLLIDAGYAPGANGAPPPFLGRRPGEIDLTWARRCFTADRPARCVDAGLENTASIRPVARPRTAFQISPTPSDRRLTPWRGALRV